MCPFVVDENLKEFRAVAYSSERKPRVPDSFADRSWRVYVIKHFRTVVDRAALAGLIYSGFVAIFVLAIFAASTGDCG